MAVHIFSRPCQPSRLEYEKLEPFLNLIATQQLMVLFTMLREALCIALPHEKGNRMQALQGVSVSSFQS